MTTTPAQVEFRARGAVARLLSCVDREVLIEGPARTGKSTGVLTKADKCAWQYPGCRILFVRATRASMTQSILQTFEDEVLLQGYKINAGATRENRTSYVYPNGSEIVVGGLDRPDRIMSTEYDMVCVFEATEITEDGYEKLLTRLSGQRIPNPQIIADCNPGAPSHWLNRRASAGKMTRLLSRHADNPRWWQGGDWTEDGRVYVHGTLGALTGVRRLRLLEGKWAQAEGVVYENWDPAVHVIDKMPKGWESWERFRSIDMGYTNPFVCQWWALDPDGRLYLYREEYQTRRLVSDWAKAILRYPEPITATISDHDAEDRATLEAGGIGTIPARKDVQSGIQAVTDRLAIAGDGRPRLFVFRDALVARDPSRDEAKQPCGFLEEIDGYSWAKTKDGRPVKEEPLKVHDHSMDTCRYMVMHLDWAGEAVGIGSFVPTAVPVSERRASVWGEDWG